MLPTMEIGSPNTNFSTASMSTKMNRSRIIVNVLSYSRVEAVANGSLFIISFG